MFSRIPCLSGRSLPCTIGRSNWLTRAHESIRVFDWCPDTTARATSGLSRTRAPVRALIADHDFSLGHHPFVGAELDIEVRPAEERIDHFIDPDRAGRVAVLDGACGPAKELPDLGGAHADGDDVLPFRRNREAVLGLSS